MIRKEKDKWILYSANGDRRLGVFKTKAEAVARERQILFFKRQQPKSK